MYSRDARVNRSEHGMAMIALLAMILVITVIGVAMVGYVNSDITLAGIQGDVSRAHYVADGGLRAAAEQLSTVPAFRGNGNGTITVEPGTGTFAYTVTDPPWSGPDAGIVQIESAGTYGRYTRRVFALVQFGATAYGIFGYNGVLIEGAGGAPARTYLAPYARSGPGPDIGSFKEINIKDTGVRVNYLIGYNLTLQDGNWFDYSLFGFGSLPAYDSNSPTIPAVLEGRFGQIVQAGFVGSSDFADLTVRNSSANKCPDSIFSCEMDVLRGPVPKGGENMTNLFMSEITKRLDNVSTVSREGIRAEAEANTANAQINANLGYGAAGAVYTPEQFECVMWYLARNPNEGIKGQIYVTGTVNIGGSPRAGQCTDRGYASKNSDPVLRNLEIKADGETRPALLAVYGGDVIVQNNNRLTIGNVNDSFSGQVVRGGLFAFSTSTANGRITLGSSSVLRAIGLAYTQNGIQVGPTAVLDLIGLSYNDISDRSRPSMNPPSFRNWNGTVVIRFDPRSTSRLEGQRRYLGIISWWSEPR